MKNFALILICTIVFAGVAGMSNSIFAEEILLETADVEESPEEPVVMTVITAPKWEEFCEPGYENATASDKKDVLNVVSVIQSARDKKNYWAQRRASFDKFLNHCKTIVDDSERGVCYTDLRRLENEKNEVYYSNKKQHLYQTNFINHHN